MNVSDAVASRRSVRRFLDRPVDPDLLRDILQRATRAPSGGNIQPWHINVVMGEPLAALKALVAKRVAEAPQGEGTEYDIYPRQLAPAYQQRTFEVGQQLYARLGIPREDKAARARWFARNFEFFGAPVGLFCHVERDHGPPQWSDLGMYLQTVMLLLREAGLDSCAQECWAIYHQTIDGFLGVPPELMLFTGMSIGWADPDALENQLSTPRAADTIHFHCNSAATDGAKDRA
ncbi:MAG: nitroreductase [Caulobacter sp.]|nr:nitroreductase [Caulobacter sp.]